MVAISGIDGNSDTVTTGDYLIGGLGDLTIADDLRLQNILLLGKEDGKILVFGKIFKMDKERIAAEPQQVTVNIGGRVERSVDPDGIQLVAILADGRNREALSASQHTIHYRQRSTFP